MPEVWDEKNISEDWKKKFQEIYNKYYAIFDGGDEEPDWLKAAEEHEAMLERQDYTYHKEYELISKDGYLHPIQTNRTEKPDYWYPSDGDESSQEDEDPLKRGYLLEENENTDGNFVI